jgi:hypothetical protein
VVPTQFSLQGSLMFAMMGSRSVSVGRTPEVHVVQTCLRPQSRLHVIRVRAGSKEGAAGTFEALMKPRGDRAALGNVALLELGEGQYGTRSSVSTPHALCAALRMYRKQGQLDVEAWGGLGRSWHLHS